jgi:fructuronate reductase
MRRRRAQGGPLAIVPCDNIPHNGAFLAKGMSALATLVDTGLAAWVRENVSFVSTSVDRITPHVSMDVSPLTGRRDAAPVVTEPFADWVLSGSFPGGRPDWESAGARFVDDIEPWENRKLWLLNGAHSILAFAGLPRGFQTVAEAIADPDCRALVDRFWLEAVQCLPEGTEHVRYRQQLVQRFSNPRIEHRLTQIAADATTKVEFRFAAVAERTMAAGREPTASATALAAWITWVLAGDRPSDTRAGEVAAAAASIDAPRALVHLVSPSLAADDAVMGDIRTAVSLPSALVQRAQ